MVPRRLTAVLGIIAGGSNVYSAATNPQDFASLAGMSPRELAAYERSIEIVGSQPLPPKPTDTSYKLVFDAAHPHMKRRPGDQRGPCPGLNTLASHGYLPRTGVATPAQIITATVDGFNMDYRFAAIVAYGSHLVDGNQLTNLMSIGGFSKLSGPPPPLPALAGGLNVHGTFEGDASLTRSDDYLGNNHELNFTLFDQLLDTMNAVGGGNYNLTAAAEFRWIRIQDSIARNPRFDFGNPRHSTAYAESTFPLGFFSNVSEPDSAVGTSAANMRSFFIDEMYPDNFHRRGTPFNGSTFLADVRNAHPIDPGVNDGVSVDSYKPIDFWGGETVQICALYHKFVNKTVDLYPDPSGALRTALIGNLENFYQVVGTGCTQLSPYK